MEKGSIELSISKAVALLSDEYSGFTLELCAGNNDINVKLNLDLHQVRTIAMLCLQHVPDIDPRFASLTELELIRLPAQGIKNLDDRCIQQVMREIQGDDLIELLWIMNCKDLTVKVMKNISIRAAEMLLDDMSAKFNTPPEKSLAKQIECGKSAITKISEILDRMEAEGVF
jgi:hypothetical protein